MLVGLPFTTTVLTGAIGKAQAIPEAHLPQVEQAGKSDLNKPLSSLTSRTKKVLLKLACRCERVYHLLRPSTRTKLSFENGSSSKWASSLWSLLSNCSCDTFDAQIRTRSIFLSIHSEVSRNYRRIVRFVVLATFMDFQLRFSLNALMASAPNFLIFSTV